MKKAFKAGHHLAWGIALTLLVLLALYASLGRQYIGLLGEYRQPIEEFIAQRTGTAVTMTALDGRWSGLAPIISIRHLAIGPDAPITADSAKIEFNLLSSLLLRRPQFNRVRVEQLVVNLHQRADGSGWFVPGLSGNGGELPDWLLDTVLGVRSADLDHFRLRLHYANGADKTVVLENFSLSGDGEFRRAFAQLNSDQGAIYLLAEAYGDPRDREAFHATAYLEIKQSRFSALAPLFQTSAPLVDSEVSGALWLNWRRGQRLSMVGELRSPELAVGALWDAPEFRFENVDVRFTARHGRGSWQVSFADFDATWRQRRLDLGGLSLSQPATGRWRLWLPSFALGDWVSILGGAEPFPGQAVMQQLSPEGDLRRVQLDLYQQENAPVSFRVRAELDEVGLRPWQGAPGAAGVSGYLEVDSEGGRAIIDSQQLSLAFPDLYEREFTLADARGQLEWELGAQRLTLRSGLLRAVHDGLPVRASLSLDLPLTDAAQRLFAEGEPGTGQPVDSRPPQMALAIGARDVAVSRHRLYTPRILNPGLLQWLDQSLLEGKVDQAAFLYHGSLTDEGQRSVQLALDVASATLKYLPDWPALEVGEAWLVLDNNHLRAGGEAKLMDAPLDPLKVEIRENDHGESTLTVNAGAELDITQVRQWVSGTPLADRVGGFLDDWRGEGQVRVGLELHQSLREGAEPRFQADVELALAQLRLPAQKLNLADVSGQLHISSENGVASQGLRGRLFGEEVTLSAEQQGSELLIAGQTRVAAADLQGWLAHSALQALEGETGVELQIHAGGKAPVLRLSSDMRGMAVLLPQPLLKPAEETRRLEIEVPLAGQEAERIITAAWGEKARLALLSREDQLLGVHLRLDGRLPGRPQVGRFTLDGRLAFAALSQWQMAMQRYLPAEGTAEMGMPLVVDNLRVGEAEAFGWIFHDVAIDARMTPQGHDIVVESQELSGRLLVPGGGSDAALRLDLARLALPRWQPEVATPEDLDPRDLPRLQVDIDDFSVAGQSWGSLGFDLYSDATGAHFTGLRGTLRGIHVDAEEGGARLDWLHDAAGEHSRLRGSFNARDIAAVLKRWNLPPAVQAQYGTVNLDVSWPGAPGAWALLTSAGRLSFELKDGLFLRGSDTATGALRLLSIFNMANVVRRLKFDFRDVFSRGIAFDSVQGQLGLADAQLSLLAPLQVKGPASAFEMTGTIDLRREVPDLRLVATLPVGSNLPWVAALVGGLPAAAGAYVVSKIFEEQVDSFSSAVYDISGTLQDPELTFQQIFDVPSKDKPGNDEPRNDEPAP